MTVDLEDARQTLLSETSEGVAGALSTSSLFVEDLLDAMPEAMAITHEGRVLHVNRAFSQLFGYSAQESAGQELDALVVPQGREHENEMIIHTLRRDGRAAMESVRQTRSGKQVAVCLRVARVRLGGEAQGMLASYRDITAELHEAEQLRYSAFHDNLTGLPNRALFLERVQLLLDRLRRRPGRAFAVVFLDLDGFKQVNDSLGHAAGDALLLEIAERLRHAVRPQDLIARLGGDEFALLLDECAEPAEVELVTERIQTQIARPFVHEGVQAQVSASMGVKLALTAGESAAEVLAHADRAMYRAKALGKARSVLSVEGVGSASV